jgi:hypothetical protein
MDDHRQPLAVNLTMAARMLGVSRPTLTTRILPELRFRQVGKRKLVIIKSIKDYLDASENDQGDDQKHQAEKSKK